MNKSELVGKVAAKTSLTKGQAARVVEALFGQRGILATELAAGGRITVQGFGAFSCGMRQGRRSVLPGSGEEVRTSARRVVRFRAGKALADMIKA